MYSSELIQALRMNSTPLIMPIASSLGTEILKLKAGEFLIVELPNQCDIEVYPCPLFIAKLKRYGVLPCDSSD